MRKPRDYDAELKALDERARQLKQRKVQQLGEMVMSTGADALAIEELAGALLAAAGQRDKATMAEWRDRGAAFFRGDAKPAARRATRDREDSASNGRGAKPADAAAGAS
jgi:hypothetical protein